MKNRSLSFKLYGVMFILIAASLAIAGIGLSKMVEIKDSMNQIAKGSVIRLGNAHVLKELLYIQLVNEKNIILDSEPSRFDVHYKRLQERDAEIRNKIDTSLKVAQEAGKRDLGQYIELYNSWHDLNKEVVSLIRQKRNDEAFLVSRDKGREIRTKIEELVDSMISRNEREISADVAEAESDYAMARNFVITFTLVSSFLGLALGTFIIRSMTKGIDEVISILTDGSGQVSNASQQIASASEELSESTSEQAASLEETVSSIEEMNSMVQRNAESALRTSKLSASSSDSAFKGKKVVEEMIGAIDAIHVSNKEIKVQIDESNENISQIVQVIAEIGEKTKVINDIVFQTKLLSFNASVEAARAGEQGKGFAVVAEEVGNLAQMSGNAATEISAMLQASIQKVEALVTETKTKVAKLIEDGGVKVETGLKIAKDCGHVLDEIVQNVADVTQMANEISTACNEQALGVQEITKAMNQLDQVTQANAATSEQVASSAEELSGQASSLRNGVEILVKTIKGHSGPVQNETFKPAKVSSTPKKMAKVVEFKAPKKEAPVSAPAINMKRASGDDRTVPSEFDERFEDA